MAIQITTYQTKPALAYDKVHVSELRISLSEEQATKANVRVTYKLYGVDADGIKHFTKEQHVAVIEDAFVTAAQKAAQGDMALAGAMQAIEAAVAAILGEQDTLGSASVVA